MYLKCVWFSNGIYYYYSNVKIKFDFSSDYFKMFLVDINIILEGEVFDVIFNDKDVKKVNLSKDVDIVFESVINFYGLDVIIVDVEVFYGVMKVDLKELIEIGLNIKLVKENGKLVEKVYKSGGLYGEVIDKIIYWLEKVKGVVEDEN